jgi:ribonuclease R
LRETDRRPGKREIARAFSLGKEDRAWLTQTLRELADEGRIDGRRSSVRGRPGLPPVAVLTVIRIDDDEVWAAPASWRREGPAPPVRILSGEGGKAAAVGNRILARIRKTPHGNEATVMRVLEAGPGEVVGVFELASGTGRIVSANKRARGEYRVRGADSGGAAPGDVVLAEVTGRAGVGLRQAKVLQRIGTLDDPSTLSLIAVHEHGIPLAFSDEALANAAAAKAPSLGTRKDFRNVPFITIDPSDARDFDDAVWAEADGAGWFARIAVADVAAFVRPGSALDREAAERGNSVYFPDRVVPMLPEALSGGVCSLQPGENRACLVAELWLDAGGVVRQHGFWRGLMRSARRFTYEDVQRIHDHGGAAADKDMLDPLWGAFAALKAARDAREPLGIETTELEVRLGNDGYVADIHPKPHLDAHRLIEEFMIATNVAAAAVVGASAIPCMYRIHDEPEPERIETLRTFLGSLGYTLAKGTRLRPRHFNTMLARARGTPYAEAVNQMVLRAQTKAVYSPENAGHFGLALKEYVHFTSPIRRYADLLGHRALITAAGLGNSDEAETDAERFAAIAAHISMTERRAMAAERDANDRYLAAFLSRRVGTLLAARISGVGRAGLFISLLDTGAQALVPMRTLGNERFRVDEAHQRIVGMDTALTFRLGDSVEVELLEATPATGGLLAALTEGGKIDKKARGRG